MLKKLAAIVMMTATVSVFAQAIVTESTSNSTTNSNSKIRDYSKVSASFGYCAVNQYNEQ
jgi:hypothetical protein